MIQLCKADTVEGFKQFFPNPSGDNLIKPDNVFCNFALQK